MRLRLRLLLLIIKTLWRKPSKVLVESVLSLRVLPNDVDITKITNDRYVALMDLGRMDLAFRLGLLKTMLVRLSQLTGTVPTRLLPIFTHLNLLALYSARKLYF